ncbi:MAG TPA: ABC transporter substrate-binding protein [Chloroflexota bacterium]|nr:ABC transporter substrate-binding protein [Chloroflexota bacterium]
MTADRRPLSRRDVIRMGALLGVTMAGGVLAACAPAAPAQPTPASAAAKPTTAAPATAAPAAAPTAAPAAAAKPTTAPAAAPQTATGAQPSGTLTIAQGVDAESLDPYVTTSGASKGMLWTIYDRLILRDLDLSLKPGLATSWKTLDDNTWQLTLRQGVSFHNGEPFNADAVKFSFARYVDPTIKNGYATLLKPVTEVQIVDPYTVNIKTSEPFAELIETLAQYVEMLPPKAAAEPNAVASRAIGTGPYKFVSWTPNDRFVVQAAGPHWSGQPRLQQVIFRPIPDATARINELKSGGVDIITNVPPLEIGNLQNAAGISLARATNAGSIILIPSFTNTDVFKTKEVRQALQYAIDKDQLIKVVLRGEAVPMTSPFPKGVVGGNVASLQQYPYDPDKAKALLAQAGYPDGFSFTFKAPDGRYLQDKAIAEAITGQLAKVGIKAELETVEWSTYVQGIVGRKYELFLLSQGGLQVGPAVQTNWSSRIKGIAWQGYTNSAVDELIDKAAQQVDGAQRQATYEQLMKTVWEDSPWIYLYHQQDIYGVGSRVKNFLPTSEAVVLLGNTQVSA